MLAELYQLARNIEAQGIVPELAHKDFDDNFGVSDHTTFVARLREIENTISLQLMPLPREHELALWTLKSYNFKYYPAVRPKSPVFEIQPEAEQWKIFKKPIGNGFDSAWSNRVQEELRKISHVDNCLPSIDLSDGLDNASQMIEWKEHDNRDLHKLSELAQSYTHLVQNPSIAGDLIFHACLDLMRNAKNNEEVLAALSLLVGKHKQPKNNPPEVEYKVQLLLDLQLSSDPSFTIYTHAMRQAVVEQLVGKGRNSDNHQPCLFSPSGGIRLTSPLPGWSAPPIVNKATAPFSKFGDEPCNARYGMSDSDALPISTETAQHLVASLKAATDPIREGINWRAIKNGKYERVNKKTKESSDVLIAYPSLKDESLRAIDLLAEPKTCSDKDENQVAGSRQFEALGKAVIERLGNVVDSGKVPNYIRILLIRKVDKWKIQLAYHATPTTQQLKEAIERWESSGNYLPEQLKVPFPSSKSPTGLTRPLRPNLLFPEEVARLLARKWMRDGTDFRPIESPPVGDIFDLFLMRSPDEHGLAHQLLAVLLERSGVLLSSSGQALRKGRGEWKSHFPKTKSGSLDTRKPDPRYEYAKALSLIGTLLHIMNSNPDDPKNAAAFKVGRLLAMADELHKQYSIAVRSKSKNESGKLKIDMPTTLIGNGLLSRAGDDPVAAIDDLRERERIYLGWAKTLIGKSKSDNPKDIAINSARKIVRLYQPLANELHALGIPRELDPESRAHLFLGYLAPVLGQNAPETNNQENTENQSKQDHE